MAGIPRQLIKPRLMELDSAVLELEAAKEILADVFGIRLSEVDKMIWSRFEAGEMGSKFCIER
ncbi:Uncharacterised protein [uncultured archaeon]|nr:Uncharacterised protein [uncultured archaeon]